MSPEREIRLILEPGDCLLYFHRDLLDWVIALKTWNRVAHVEVYHGDGMSVASRNGIGVNLYPLRLWGLAYIRRPTMTFEDGLAYQWFQTVRGQHYDWIGLLCFTLAVKQGSPDRMFCSEFVTRYYRHGGIDVVAPDYDADLVAPAQCLQTPSLMTVWKTDRSTPRRNPKGVHRAG